MTDKTISPLRQRMIEDMEVRGFTACTQRGYIAAVRNFTVFLGLWHVKTSYAAVTLAIQPSLG